MMSNTTDAGEPTIVALIDAVQAWQRALETTLSVSGLDSTKWMLLRGIARGDYVRHQPYNVSEARIDVDMAERLLAELYRDRWIAFVDHAGRTCGPAARDGVPIVAEPQRRRVERIALSMKALHSVSLGPLSGDERALLCTLLQKMRQTLDRHSDRQHALLDDIGVVDNAPPARSQAPAGPSAWPPLHGAPVRRNCHAGKLVSTIPWRG